MCKECNRKIEKIYQRSETENNNMNYNDKQQINYGFVNAPFLSDKDNQINSLENDELNKNENNFRYNNKQNDSNEDYINNLIENIFEQLKIDEYLNNNSSLKNTFEKLNENEKNEIIEGIKIKIENKEQEEKLKNILKIIN